MQPAAVKKQAQKLADRLTIYIVAATLIGARLGHFLFYEQPSEYLSDPLEIFRIRNGGLASHGAVIAIVLAVILFCHRYKKEFPKVTWVRLLDLLSPSAAIVACLIRIGNFFNQEILGTVSTVPWAVVFGHPADGSWPTPRHPVQLYEAFGYLAIFALLWRLSKKTSILMDPGKLVGILLILVFSFRFLIEFFKTEQSHLLGVFYLTMGQMLSIPFVFLGVAFFSLRRFEKWAARK